MSCITNWITKEDGSIVLSLQLTGDEYTAWKLVCNEIEDEKSLRKNIEKERDYYRQALEEANDKCAAAIRILPYDEGCQSIDTEIWPKIKKGLEYRSINRCDGCAYNVNNIVMRANCIGCMGFDEKPHKVPEQVNPPLDWFTYKK